MFAAAVGQSIALSQSTIHRLGLELHNFRYDLSRATSADRIHHLTAQVDKTEALLMAEQRYLIVLNMLESAQRIEKEDPELAEVLGRCLGAEPTVDETRDFIHRATQTSKTRASS